MSTNHTPNYSLCQWEPGDPVLRADFNADNAKIDAALGAHTKTLSGLSDSVSALQSAVAGKQDNSSAVKLAAGSYIGDGTEGRVISVGFTPKAVFVFPNTSAIYFDNGDNRVLYGGLAVSGSPAKLSSIEAISIRTGGFQVTAKSANSNYVYTNRSGTTYHYIALG